MCLCQVRGRAGPASRELGGVGSRASVLGLASYGRAQARRCARTPAHFVDSRCREPVPKSSRPANVAPCGPRHARRLRKSAAVNLVLDDADMPPAVGQAFGAAPHDALPASEALGYQAPQHFECLEALGQGTRDTVHARRLRWRIFCLEHVTRARDGRRNVPRLAVSARLQSFAYAVHAPSVQGSHVPMPFACLGQAPISHQQLEIQAALQAAAAACICGCEDAVSLEAKTCCLSLLVRCAAGAQSIGAEVVVGEQTGDADENH